MRFLFAIALLPFLAVPVRAEIIDTFKDWSAFAEGKGRARTCYMGGEPKKEEGNYKQRGETLMFVTHRPGEKSFDVVSVAAGYAYQEGSEVEVEIDGQDFALFTDGETAWARDTKTDKALVAAMKRGRRMIVRGTSRRGTLTTDTYSLLGFSKAHGAIGKACGVK